MISLGMDAENTSTLPVHEWSPLDFLKTDNNILRFVVLVLNRPIKCDREVTLSLWKRAALRVAVDGGCNRWLSFLDGETCIPPEFITGDMDSAKPEVLLHFEKQGTQIVRTPDQDDTDYTKALKIVGKELKTKKQKVDGVIAVVDTSGRLDHILANINTLFKADEILASVPVYQLAGDSLSWLLRPGRHRIAVPEELRVFWCSLAPVGAPARVSTTGLKWNLGCRYSATEFGGMVSTSNTYDGSPVVTVTTNSELVWSMGLRDS